MSHLSHGLSANGKSSATRSLRYFYLLHILLIAPYGKCYTVRKDNNGILICETAGNARVSILNINQYKSVI